MVSRLVPQMMIRMSLRSSPLILVRVPTARTFVAPTSLLLAKKVVQVPTMGDSITEGTIVEWTVQVGQAVKDGDVVALVETDKVTVDIKAVMDGIITQQFGAVDDTVEVGSDLYEIDTEAVATVQASEASATKAPEPAVASAAVSSAALPSPPPASHIPAKTTDTLRVPSIHFLGKDGWMKKLAGAPVLPPVPKNFGRPIFTEEEMEALLTGGANLRVH